MGTPIDKLAYLKATKEAIKAALKGKGQTVADSDTFRSYADKVSAIETGSKPTITVSSSGLITATSGEFSSTKQLTTQSSKTWTPGTSAQGINAGTYVTGYQTILGDSDLIPENIKSGVEIFGVKGNLYPIYMEPFNLHGIDRTSTDASFLLPRSIKSIVNIHISSNIQGPASDGFDAAFCPYGNGQFWLLKTTGSTGNYQNNFYTFYSENAVTFSGSVVTISLAGAPLNFGSSDTSFNVRIYYE